MSVVVQHPPRHELLAADRYWPDPTETRRPGMIDAALQRLAEYCTSATPVVKGFRGLYEGGLVPRPTYLQPGEELPQIGPSERGVVQVLFDSRTTYSEPKSRAARYAASIAVDADTFNREAAKMEEAASLGPSRVMTAVAPGVFVGRAAFYVRGAPGSKWGHVAVRRGALQSAIDPSLRPWVDAQLWPDGIEVGRVADIADKKVNTLSKVALAIRLQPGVVTRSRSWWREVLDALVLPVGSPVSSW